MNRTIVVGVDDLEPSRAALEWALRRAEQLHCPVSIVHTVYAAWLQEGYVYYNSIIEDEKKLVRDIGARAAALAPSVESHAELRTGNTPRVLRELSKNASLVVVGTERKGHVEGEFFGSVSLQTAALGLCPVAVIPLQPATDRSGVVVGVDGSADALVAVALAAAEANRTKQDLYAVYAARVPHRRVLRAIPEDSVNERIEEERVVLAESVAGLGGRYPDLTVHQVFETDVSPAKALLKAAAAAQLLVVGSHGRGAISRLLMGSVSQEVLLHIPCPTIITRTAAAES